jgi:secreted trypsin-like serine protease
VRPIEEFEEFWTGRGLTPPKRDENTKITGRIVNGEIAPTNRFEYQAALLANFGASGWGLCGGSVITPRTVLTAAHCVSLNTVSNFTNVILGARDISVQETRQQRIGVPSSAYRVHRDWNLRTISNDIALLITPVRINYNQFVQPVALPSVLTETFQGVTGTVSGWGVYADSHGRSSNVLRFVSNPIMTNTQCATFFRGSIVAGHICMSGANRRSACSGDSGGPLTVQRDGQSLQVGVVSFGLAAGCEFGWPSVFVRVTSYDAWIKANWLTA